MEFYILFFLVGFALGSVTMVRPLLGYKKENDKLRKTINHMSSKRGRIILTGSPKRSQ